MFILLLMDNQRILFVKKKVIFCRPAGNLCGKAQPIDQQLKTTSLSH